MYWIYAHGFQAVVDYYRHYKVTSARNLIHQLYLTAKSTKLWKSWYGYGYYDDAAWMGLTLVEAFSVTGNKQYLTSAVSIYKMIRKGWDTKCCGSHKGGIWWNTDKKEKVTASNLAPAILALRLARITKKRAYRAFGRKVFNFWSKNMFDAKTGKLVYDHIDRVGKTGGVLTKGTLSYDQGLMVGASVEMYQDSGNKRFLNMAGKAAEYMMRAQTKKTRLGLVINDSPCTEDCPQYKNPAFRYLVQYYEVTRDPKIFAFLKANIEAINKYAAKKLKNGLYVFSVSWAGPKPGRKFSILNAQQNSAVSAIILFNEMKHKPSLLKLPEFKKQHGRPFVERVYKDSELSKQNSFYHYEPERPYRAVSTTVETSISMIAPIGKTGQATRYIGDDISPLIGKGSNVHVGYVGQSLTSTSGSTASYGNPQVSTAGNSITPSEISSGVSDSNNGGSSINIANSNSERNIKMPSHISGTSSTNAASPPTTVSLPMPRFSASTPTGPTTSNSPVASGANGSPNSVTVSVTPTTGTEVSTPSSSAPKGIVEEKIVNINGAKNVEIVLGDCKDATCSGLGAALPKAK